MALNAELKGHVGSTVGFERVTDEAASALASLMKTAVVKQGETLFSNAASEYGLYFVLDGELRAMESAPFSGVVRTIATGEALDELQVLAGIENSVRVEAARDSEVAWVDGSDLDALASQYSEVADAMERLHRRQLLSRLHSIFGTFDRAFLDLVEQMADWVHLTRGELLFEQNNRPDGIFLVVSGRLRTSAFDREGTELVLGESCRGEVVGELAFFGVEQRDERVQAVRDSIAVGFTKVEFEQLVARRPEILRYVTRTLVERLHRTPSATSAAGVTNIALVAVTPGAPLGEFAARLTRQLQPLGRAIHLTSERVGHMMEEPRIAEAWDESDEEARLLAWLEARETSHRFVVYEADPDVTLWTRRCTRQADRVILVADAAADPKPGDVEKGLKEVEGHAEVSQVLALIHQNGDRLPSGTRSWLTDRNVAEHYHIRWDRDGDFGRLARVLAGRAIGLVLGGGGARGFAHIGILKALEEAGIPVDMIGGTSMGAAVAAQYAMGWTPDQLAKMFRRVYIEIKPQNEYTIPMLSVVGTGRAEKCGVMVFGDTEIEDTWTPYFCISSSLTTAQMVVHRRGLLRKATLASASLPGFVPPVLEGKELLVDGGLLNNVPTDVMRQLGCGTVLASEVTIEEDSSFTSDRIPTTWELVRGKFRRRKDARRFPSLVELAVRASMLHSTSVQSAAVNDADFCFRPPLDGFGMVDFLRLDDIVSVGYDYAAGVLPELRAKPSFKPLISS